MTVTDIEIKLPSPTMTPAELAWDAIAYMEAHPDEVDLEDWGGVHPKDASRTVGCFAHHLVKRAGYAFLDGDNARMYVEGPRGTEHISITAMRLLNVTHDDEGLFRATGTLAGRAELVERTFGPRPASL